MGPEPNQARLGELIQDIRNDAAGAIAEFRRIFLPGCSFLIRRRLGESDVQEGAQSTLDAAIGQIREDKSIEGKDLPALIRKLIAQRFAAVRDLAARNGAGQIALEAAKATLEGMSPVERDALRRCYVLGESPESFLKSLKLTPDQFREIRIRARTQFSTRTSHEINVA